MAFGLGSSLVLPSPTVASCRATVKGPARACTAAFIIMATSPHRLSVFTAHHGLTTAVVTAHAHMHTYTHTCVSHQVDPAMTVKEGVCALWYAAFQLPCGSVSGQCPRSALSLHPRQQQQVAMGQRSCGLPTYAEREHGVLVYAQRLGECASCLNTIIWICLHGGTRQHGWLKRSTVAKPIPWSDCSSTV